MVGGEAGHEAYFSSGRPRAPGYRGSGPCGRAELRRPAGTGRLRGVALIPDDVVVADADGAVPVPATLLPGVITESVEQERMEARIAEVAAGVPLPGLYPPNGENRAHCAAWVRRQR